MMDLPVIFEDNHLLVIEKPVNVLSQADYTGDPDILNLAKAYIKDKYAKPGAVYLGLVHRLDRPVGGVMVLARTSKAAARLSSQIREGQFRKTYLAVVRGRPKQEGTLVHYLKKNERTNMVTATKSESPVGKRSELRFQLVENASDLSLVRIELITGRAHQIRVQFATLGYPLFGDQRYGNEENHPGQQIALWAHSVTLFHPTKKEEMTFISIPPNHEPWNRFSRGQSGTEVMPKSHGFQNPRVSRG